MIDVISVDTYMRETLETLVLFEKDCMSTFLDKEEKKIGDGLGARIKKLEEK